MKITSLILLGLVLSSDVFGAPLWEQFLGCYETVKVGNRLIPLEHRETTRWKTATYKDHCGKKDERCVGLEMVMADHKHSILFYPTVYLNGETLALGADRIRIQFRGEKFDAQGKLTHLSFFEMAEFQNVDAQHLHLVYVQQPDGHTTLYANVILKRVSCP